MASDPHSDPWQLWITERGQSFLLYARQQTRCEEDACDVVQEALTESWNRCGGSIPDPALVFATIRRRAIDHGRATDSRIRRDAGHVARTDSWFQPDFSAADTHLVVSEALLKLPDPLRETVTLRLWGDLSFPEISSITGVPVATATSRYRLAIERLRETLGPCFS